jgi:FkbM family methyltransferase
MNRQMLTNKILNALNRRGFYRTLAIIIYFMYKIKGRNISSVSFIRDLRVWEFQIDNMYYYSTGPGWSYDYQFLLDQFKKNLGYFYLPQEGDIVIDIGAGVGEETIVLSKLVGPTGKVLAVEAHPVTFKTLALNIQKNKLDNVILINKAISDASGRLFIQNVENSLANKVTTSNDTRGEGTFDVDAITFDELIEIHELDKVDFVKVNIEGAEQLLIKGLIKTMSKILRLAISCHDFRYKLEGDKFFKTKDIILTFFSQNNYDIMLRETQISLLDDYVYASSPKLNRG